MTARLARAASYVAFSVRERADLTLQRLGLVVHTTAGYKRAQRTAFEYGREIGRSEGRAA